MMQNNILKGIYNNMKRISRLAIIFVVYFCLQFLLTGCEFAKKTNGINNENNFMYRSYANIISSIIGEKQEALYKKYYRGALKDLDNNGQKELIVVYLANDKLHENYKIYTYKSKEIKILGEGELFVNAGAAKGGISLINYNGEQYICIWQSNGEAGKRWHEWHSCDLYQLKNENLLKIHTFSFNYYKNSSLDTEVLNENYTFLKDGNKISFDEFLKTQSAFSNPIENLCEISEKDIGLALEELLKKVNSN